MACRLGPGSLIGVYWKLTGLGLLVFVAYVAAAVGLTLILHLPARTGGPLEMLLHGRLPVWGFSAYLAMYLVLGIALGLLARIYK